MGYWQHDMESNRWDPVYIEAGDKPEKNVIELPDVADGKRVFVWTWFPLAFLSVMLEQSLRYIIFGEFSTLPTNLGAASILGSVETAVAAIFGPAVICRIFNRVQSKWYMAMR